MISSILFFFNDTATTEIYTLSLHDALPIYDLRQRDAAGDLVDGAVGVGAVVAGRLVVLLAVEGDVILRLGDRVLELPREVDPGVDVGVEIRAPLLELG